MLEMRFFFSSCIIYEIHARGVFFFSLNIGVSLFLLRMSGGKAGGHILYR